MIQVDCLLYLLPIVLYKPAFGEVSIDCKLHCLLTHSIELALHPCTGYSRTSVRNTVEPPSRSQSRVSVDEEPN